MRSSSVITARRLERLAAIALVSLAAAGLEVALAHGEAKARHGGIVQTAHELAIELVALPDGAAIYVDDHGKPVPPAGLKGKLTVLQGNVRSEAVLVAAGDRLEAKGVALAPGAKVVAALTIANGKVVTVRYTVK